MPKEEWGVKRVCPTTGKRFYDLGRDPVVSPYTGEIVPLDTGKNSRVLIREEKEKTPTPEAAESEDDASLIDDADAVLDDDDDTDVDLGDDVLDDDDDNDNVSLDEIADMSSDDDDS